MEKKTFGLSTFIFFISFAGLAFAITPKEKLGQLIYQDTSFSAGGNQSCQTCHHPSAGFADPVNRKTLTPVSLGSIPDANGDQQFGGRNAPPAAYAAYSPSLFWDNVDQLYIGGLFWDGRATGNAISGTGTIGGGPTYDPLADQAKGPFLNPVEMALPDEQAVIDIFMANPNYIKLYKQAFPADTGMADVYNNIARAISAFEKTNVMNKFTSKFDAFRAEQERQGQDVSLIKVDTAIVTKIYSVDEIQGLALFNTIPDQAAGIVGAGCAQCHPVPGIGKTAAESVFTDFSYDNLGIPKNMLIENLAGYQKTDYGLGAQVDILNDLGGGNLTTFTDNDGQVVVDSQAGKFKVSSLRNIAKTAPYGHNGYFTTLLDIVHFYNTRDLGGWAPPEVPQNLNTSELGNLGLSPLQERQIVAFMETLTDGYLK